MNETDPSSTTDATGATGATGATAAATADEDRRGAWAAGRHAVDVGQLVMGVAFLGLVGLWAALTAGGADGDDLRWLLPIPWLVAGGAGLLAAAVGGRRRGRTG